MCLLTSEAVTILMCGFRGMQAGQSLTDFNGLEIIAFKQQFSSSTTKDRRIIAFEQQFGRLSATPPLFA